MKGHPVHRHVTEVLRQNGHSVGRVWRVFSPGDLGAVDCESTTVLFSTSDGWAKTALVWTEQVKEKDSKEPVEKTRTRVLSGWID